MINISIMTPVNIVESPKQTIANPINIAPIPKNVSRHDINDFIFNATKQAKSKDTSAIITLSSLISSYSHLNSLIAAM